MKRWIVPIALIFLVLAALAVRLYRLGDAPKGMLVDEVSFGYIAHSLVQTGKDEHGVAWPLVFRAFGDQKLPMYAYTLLPFIKFLGLNAVATRLPSALAGTALVLAVFWFLRLLKFSSKVSLFGALVVVISPWTFLLSRFSFESHLALLCFVLALCAYLKAQHTHHWKWWVIAGVLTASTWYAYIAYRVITLLLLGLLGLKYVLVNNKSRKNAVILLIGFVITVLPLLPLAFSKAGSARFTQIGLFSDIGPVLEIDEQRSFCGLELSQIECAAVWNKPHIYLRMLATRYLETFSPQFLFTQGDELNYLHVESFGQFPLVFAPLFFLGLAAFIMRSKELEKSHPHVVELAIALAITAPIPGILAGDPHTVRFSAFIPFVILTIVVGFAQCTELKQSVWKKLIFVILAGGIALHSTSFYVRYFTAHIKQVSYDYNTQVIQMFEYLRDNYPQVPIYLKSNFSDPIMYYAFVNKIDPKFYQENVVLGELEPSGFQHAVALGNLKLSEEAYRPVVCKKWDPSIPGMGVYITPEHLSSSALLYEIFSPNGVHSYLSIYCNDNGAAAADE